MQKMRSLALWALFLMAGWAAYAQMGWPGLAMLGGGLLMWFLLQYTRMMTVMQRAARRPVGYVDSAVMLNAKLAKGQTLMHVLARTRSIGERVDSADGDAKGGIEAYAWRDAGGSRVVAQFSRGRLVAWTLDRSQDSPAEGAP
ncbi:MAG TPA: glycerate kinase [Burkholderiaceae bacterium]|nr:glycerate kinase [Burkholderiaceae bacterium]